MIQWLADRLRRKDDEGFTLIELMVVVLIIAILIAIAIPTFLGARRRAQDRAAQSSLRNTVTAAKAIFTDEETYSNVTDTELAAGEPALDFDEAASDDPVEVIMLVAAGDRFVATTYSKSGKCWYVQDITGPANTTNAGTRWAVNEGTSSCSSGEPVATSALWQRNPSDATDIP